MIYKVEDRVGLYAIGRFFIEELCWIFRDQPVNDFGIDALVEITESGKDWKQRVPTGKLIGLQIKSGKSYFKESHEKYYVFRGKQKHLDYWLNYALPVILICYNKATDKAYWQEISKSTVLLTAKAFKVNIPKQNILEKETLDQLFNTTLFKDHYQYKLWQLKNSSDEIGLLLQRPLFVYGVIESMPKLDYYHLYLVVSDLDTDTYHEVLYAYDDDDQQRFEYSLHLPTGKHLTEAVTDTLPWAGLWLGSLPATEALLVELEAEQLLGYDLEDAQDDICILRQETNFPALACYLTGSQWFRLELKPNELTNAFLQINHFLNKEPIVTTRILP